MEQQELISVIIPVYKVEQYLSACLDSLLVQTYQNLEVILVDDGSPDNSGAICDEYAAKDRRIRVIHQKNGGVSAARNVGLDAASGAYIGFVDADDYVEPDMYQILYEELRSSSADIAQCGYHLHSSGTISDIYGVGHEGLYDREQSTACLLAATTPWWYLWCKLFRAELFQGIRFNTELRINEDMFLCFQLFLKTERLINLRKPLYHHIFYPGTLTMRVHNQARLHLLDNLKVSKWILEWVDRELPSLSDLACQSFVSRSVLLYEKALIFDRNHVSPVNREIMFSVRSELCSARCRILNTAACGSKYKLKTRLITDVPQLYNLLFSFWIRATAWRHKNDINRG